MAFALLNLKERGACIVKTQNLVKTRNFCVKCLRAEASCLCSLLKPFASGPLFAILMHPKERRARSGTGTGRITHLCLQNSYLFEGVNFEQHAGILSLLADPTLRPLVLYPGAGACNLSTHAAEFAKSLCPHPAELEDQNELSKTLTLQRPLVFVIDGSWSCSKTLVNANKLLLDLPRICFTPQKQSAYTFKTQPRKDCLSTLEAVHSLLSLFNELNLFPTFPPEAHDNLLHVFAKMVEFQVGFSPEPDRSGNDFL